MQALWHGMVFLPRHEFLQLTKSRADQVATEDALLLQCLEKAGAVFHVRTNQPQSLMVLQPTPSITVIADKKSTSTVVTTSPALP